MASAEYRTDAYVNGVFTKSSNSTTFEVFNPTTGEKIADVADCVSQDAKVAIESAKKAFKSWSNVMPRERSALLLRIEQAILAKQDDLAKLISLENGKPLNESKGEVGFSASFFGWFAGECRRLYGDLVPSPVASKAYFHIRQPLGVAAFITPWNFPLGMLARKVAAALAAGCTCVVKPAEDTPLTTLAFAEILERAGLPAGVFNAVPCSRNSAAEIGLEFCNNPAVKVISFTGSTAVGKWLQEKASSSLKRVHLELGGNAPFIVFSSARIDDAVVGCLNSKFRNTGQTCVCANRIFVQSDIHEEFVEKFAKAIEEQIGGGSFGQGPIINERQLDRLDELVKGAIEKDSLLVVRGGGKDTKRGGLFYQPTLLTGATGDERICRDEIFGPVAVIIKFETEEEAIAKANDCEKGLAAYFYSEDYRQIWRVTRALEAGMVGANEALFSTCEAAFGGVKESGYGKEGSKYGLDDFTELKMVALGNLLA